MSQEKEKLIKWLESGDETILNLDCTYHSEAYLRHRYNDELDLILTMNATKDGHLNLKDEIKCEGIWSRKTKELYYEGYKLGSYLKEYIKPENAHSRIFDDIGESVKRKVEELVKPYEDNLKLQDISEEDVNSQIHYATTNARKQYLNGIECENRYECDYSINNVQSMVIRYITDRDALICELGKQYLEEYKEEIKMQIIRAKLTDKELQKLNEGADLHLKTMREIICAVPQDCKTVNVTTVIDGTELTFKTEAHQLRMDCGEHYSTWNIQATYRALYEAAYGRYRDYRPEDITKITYGKKVLYERKAD